ncbi:hypothetical protein phiHau3_32 [Streptomyces phage phiHau3]|uniref:Uncharacterized protein n=1 Tax=Streptomyces phage phiHau3 TaxID=1204524 RepID=K4IB09_9CAUD|nr:hypothetical protein phiHau3_32 [Streptomyces phage phiHau3]AFU62009.1 hypothetical protein phiHau3_32 [Streptomyces phage phiHau3]
MLAVLEQAQLVADNGRIWVFIDAEEEDYRLVAAEGYDSAIMKDVLDYLELFGLELVDDSEYEPEFDEEGRVISYLCETDPKVVGA